MTTPLKQEASALRHPETDPEDFTIPAMPWLVDDAEPAFERSLRGPDHVARYVSLDDRAREERDAAVRAIFPEALTFSYRELDTAFLSRNHGRFHVFLLGGSDLVRIASALRRNALMLRHCAKIAISHDCQPRKIARALNAGFDDVMDVAVHSAEEIVARTRAIVARYQAVLPRTRGDDLTAIAQHQLLSPRETELIAVLAESFGAPVPYAALQHRIVEHVGTLTIEHLRVIVSKVRTKLNAGYAIVPEKGIGYRLLNTTDDRPAR